MDENQIELGYSLAAELAETLEDQPQTVLDTEENGGRVIVTAGVEVLGQKPGAILLYLCTDAQAWGTLSLHNTAQEALDHANETLAALRASMMEEADEN